MLSLVTCQSPPLVVVWQARECHGDLTSARNLPIAGRKGSCFSLHHRMSGLVYVSGPMETAFARQGVIVLTGKILNTSADVEGVSIGPET